MNIKRFFPAVLWIVVFTQTASAQGRQNRWEVMGMGGVAAYSGDLGQNEKKLFGDYPQKLGYSFGIGGRFIVNNFISIRANVMKASVSGADSLADNKGRRDRNLSFRSPVNELSMALELSLINWRQVKGTKSLGARGNINLYVFGGFAIFSFNPEAYYNGEWYRLQPLGTEGQGIVVGKNKYSLTSSALFGGAGIRKRVTGNLSMGVEFSVRKTNTDYLDDVSTTYINNEILSANYGPIAGALADRYKDAAPKVAGSQRGSSKENDYYGFLQFTVAYKFGNNYIDGRPGSKRSGARARCFQF